MPFSTNKLRRRYKYSTPMFLKMNALHLVIFATVGICFIISFFNLNDRPDTDNFLMVFFKEPFIMFLGLYTAWFISSFRTLPSQREEYSLLNSLPVTNKKICNHFVAKDLLQYVWIPGCIIILYLGLLSVSPVSHLIRLSLLTLLLYFLFIEVKMIFHLSISIHRKGVEVYKYPAQNNPLIMVLIITGFALSQLAYILNPALNSGTFFVLSVVMFGLMCFSLLFLAQKLFDRWKNENLAFRMNMNSTGEVWSSGYSDVNLFQKFSEFHPLLIKNLVTVLRGKNKMSVLVTVIFIICAYLVSMNNENIGDAISVLFGIFCFYTILFSYRVINQFTSSLESPSLIYLLPLKKRDLYICHFIPTLGWVFLVAFLFTVLILTSGSSLESAGIFLLKSIAAGFIFLQGSFNYTLGSYPDIKKAKKQFIYWCVLLLILSAIFYVFAIIVVLFMVMVSLYQLKKIKFYKVS